MTTFIVSYMVIGDVEKSGSVAAIDTVLKTIFYYFHEGCYDKARKKKWSICYDDENITDDENMSDDGSITDDEIVHNNLNIEANKRKNLKISSI